ncbi:MAG: transposase [Candidatus Bathyarchaeia archaeon]
MVGYDGYKHIKGTKIHAVVSPESLPLSVQAGPGDEHDSKHFIKLLEDVRVKHGRGRPRSRPKEVIGDSAYDARRLENTSSVEE